MARRTNAPGRARYELACEFLARASRKMWPGRMRLGSTAQRHRIRLKKLRSDLELAGMTLEPELIVSAARGGFVVFGALAVAITLLTSFLWGTQHLVIQLFAAGVAPFVAREVVLSYPASAANRRAERLMRGVPEAANLMIMSLRHESSLSRAIRFASERGSEFSKELKRCAWSVLMAEHASFEDSLQELGDRWEKHDPELKASLHAMVTASCESTEEGKRRALDRANSSLISGAKKRIEAYALSLSTPSMVLFGVGILLPLMIGSLLPMMSWSLWSPGTIASGGSEDGSDSLTRMIFLMNVLFPGIATVVALGAVSRHPLGPSDRDRFHAVSARALVATAALSGLSVAACHFALDDLLEMMGTLLALTVPWALLLLISGRDGTSNSSLPASGLEDALFKTGARMLEGENFESALHRASADIGGEASGALRRLSLNSTLSGRGFDESCREESRGRTDANVLDGFRVVREAASKDELSAGMLAMDIAAYLKDLRDLEMALKNRLKPTISMMKVTAYALGPVVMGVTFAIYLTLIDMASGESAGLDPGAFFIVLGAFLAESNGVVTYFIWGIEGGRDDRALAWSLGMCVLVSELVYMATALAAS